jgi:hypothetical protein
VARLLGLSRFLSTIDQLLGTYKKAGTARANGVDIGWLWRKARGKGRIIWNRHLFGAGFLDKGATQ